MEICKARAAGKVIARWSLLAVGVLALVVAASAQQGPGNRAAAPTGKGSPCVQPAPRTHRNNSDVCATPAKSKEARAANLKLIDLAPVNPMALAKTLRPPAAKASPKASAAGSTVTEFEVGSAEFPAVGNSVAFACATEPTRRVEKQLCATRSKRAFLKDVHGEAYGALAPGLDGGHTAGAAVGASSKSGKAHIFVETNHNGESSPR